MLGIRRLLAAAGGIILCSAAVITANAERYDISAGNIAVTASPQGQIVTYLGNEYEDAAPVITGSTQENTVMLTAQANQRLNVTFEALSIDFSTGENGAPVVICGEGSTVVKLSGTSALKASAMNAAMDVRAPLYLRNAGEEPGELIAEGGALGAGIGGGAGQSACEISILGGRIRAVGGAMAAGIGGGQYGDGDRIAVLGGEVDAVGGSKAAGIGAGWCGSSSYVTLMGGEVAASGETAVGSTKDALCVDIAASDSQRQLKLDDGDAALIPVGDAVLIPAECKTLHIEENTEVLPAEEAVEDGEAIAEATEETTEVTTELATEEPEKTEETALAAEETEQAEETTEATEETKKAEETTEAAGETEEVEETTEAAGETEEVEETTEAAEATEQTEETTEAADEEPEKAEKTIEEAAAESEKPAEAAEAEKPGKTEETAEEETSSAEKNKLTFEEEKIEAAAETAEEEKSEGPQKQTESADEAAEETSEEKASEDKKEPEHTPAETLTEEKADTPEAIFTTETLCVQDEQGNCQEFTIIRNNNTLEIHADSKDVVLKFSADDVKLWQDNGIYMIRLSFGGRNARTTVHGIQKWFDEKTQETFLKIHIRGGMTLIKDGTSYALP